LFGFRWVDEVVELVQTFEGGDHFECVSLTVDGKRRYRRD